MTCLNQCCCCCNLKTGGVVLGWIEAVFRLIGIVIFCIMISNPYLFMPRTPEETVVDGTQKIIFQSNERIVSIDEGRDNARIMIRYGGVGGLVISVICLVSAILLISGAIKGNRFMLLPWLILNKIDIVLSGIGAIALLFMTPLVGVPITVFVCLKLYFWICILSLFQDIREQESKRQEQSVLESLKNTVTGYPQPPAYERLNEAPLV